MPDSAMIESKSEVAVQDDDTPQLMNVIAQAARDPQVDVSKMEALLRMKREEEDRDAKRAFNRAFVACKREVGPVFRNKYNEQTKSRYADAAAVADVVDPIQERHGFSITFGTGHTDRPGYYLMVADLLHEEGHEKRYEAEIPEDKTGIKGTVNKTATHAFGSSMTYGARYMKILIWNLTVKDDDGNGAGRKPEGQMTEQQVGHLRRLIEQTDLSEAKFVEYLHSQNVPGETLEDMPFSAYENAQRALNKRIRALASKNNQETLT